MAEARLRKDYSRLVRDPPSEFTAAPLDDNLLHWKAVIFGAEDTIWDGGVFELHLEFSSDYPNAAPKVKFTTEIFHPNVYADGKICLDILQNQWSPVYDVSAILTSILSLLTDPNPNSPANAVAAKLFRENRVEYERRVRAAVAKSVEQQADQVDEEAEEDEAAAEGEGEQADDDDDAARAASLEEFKEEEKATE